jgi:sec-independent protein translocase protein TatA
MGLSFWHLIILLIIVLLFFGPNRLPGLGKSLGESIRGFKKGLEGDEIDVQARREQIQNQQNPQQPDQNQSQTQNTNDKNKV